ncbi:hypothetical protein BS17DRAFT_771933 [Gyrodon lividus]|nr:hypothetical protein BS17DRAFT_771933 [Gyrodon lividus]
MGIYQRALVAFTLVARESGSKRCNDPLQGQGPISDDSFITIPSERPWCTTAHPCRKIVFQLWGHDQGRSSWHIREDQGIYRASRTWFDARIEKTHLRENCVSFSPRVLEDSGGASTHVQFNVHAKRETTHHTITWHYLDSEADTRGEDWKALDGRFVNTMRSGDCIALWMRARERAWICTLEKAIITVYWVV